jgi:exopolyphosphatase/guanosine-5'-triphosphate,3'-diphosphate pyrophosphatase
MLARGRLDQPGSGDVVQRAAVIDVGSNTLHLLVADCTPDSVHAVHDLRLHSGIGVAAAATGHVGTAATRGLAAAVKRFARRAQRYDAEHLVLVATQAVRAARDRDAVIAALEEAAGVPLLLLSEAGEAELCLAGAALDPLPGPPFLIADIGGGSTDLAVVGPGGVLAARSLPIGSGVLAARYLRGDPPSRKRCRAAFQAVESLLQGVDVGEHAALPEVVVTGGAARRLRRQYGAGAHVDHPAPAVRLPPLVDRLLTAPSARWPHSLKDPERAQITRAGAVILQAILGRWYIGSWRVSSYGLREGALRYYVEGRSLIGLTERPPEAA